MVTLLARRGTAALALAAGLVLVAASARAQPGQPPSSEETPTIGAAEAEAQALFRRGVELGEQDRWAEALEHFRRSRRLVERPNTVFNVGFALFRLGRFVAAIAALDEYLALTEGETSARREEAVRLRGEAAASVAEITLEVVPPGARVLVDGEPATAPVGSARVLRLDPGRHLVRADAAGHEEGVLEISVLAGERGERTLALAATAALEVSGGNGGGAGAGSETGGGAGGGSVLEEPVFWIVAAVLVVGAGVGIGAGVAVASQGGSPSPYGGSTGVVLDALRF